MVIQVDPEPQSPDGCESDALESVLSDSDHLQVMLESGKFLSATGFKILSADRVELEDIHDDTIKADNGVLTFLLTWKQ
jgi:hypothetical protein